MVNLKLSVSVHMVNGIGISSVDKLIVYIYKGLFFLYRSFAHFLLLRDIFRIYYIDLKDIFVEIFKT